MRHVGLDPAAVPPHAWARLVADTKHRNGAGHTVGMRADTRALLRAFYAPFNAATASLLGDDAFRFDTQ